MIQDFYQIQSECSAMENIRNFSIIAHIDHGKSTLSDRLIQKAGIISDRDFKDQILDTMEIERERGITIKSQTVCIPYTALDGQTYHLNLIDTPGHVDFTYEVSRALASCEGALLLIDASQGVEAQTLANLYLAMEHNLEIIPVINKIDLPSADIDRVKAQIEEDLGLDPESAILASAKAGLGIDDVLEAIVQKLPPPAGDPKAPLKALIFDSHYDAFRGTIVHFRIFEGTIKPGDIISFMSNQAAYKVEEVGVFQIQRIPRKQLTAGEVGYMIAGIKTVSDTVRRYGHAQSRPCVAALPGFREAKPVVFSSIYPVASMDTRNWPLPSKSSNSTIRPWFMRRTLRGPGIRISMRLSGSAASRGGSGTPGARIRSLSDSDRAFGPVSARHERRIQNGDRQSGSVSGSNDHRSCARTLYQGYHHCARPDMGVVMTNCAWTGGNQPQLPVSDQQPPGNGF